MLLAFPEGLFTAEAARILRGHHLDVPDVPEAEARLIEAMGQGEARRIDVGDSALWAKA
jgi:hypothetical protein